MFLQANLNLVVIKGHKRIMLYLFSKWPILTDHKGEKILYSLIYLKCKYRNRFKKENLDTNALDPSFFDKNDVNKKGGRIIRMKMQT